MKQLTQETIDNIFESAQDQRDCIVALYRIAFPMWDDIATVDGYPKISKATNEYIFSKFFEFDKINHPRVLPGGLWLNNGFSSLDSGDLVDWVVESCEFTLI